MKLVGATDWFIRWPFVIEGVIVGAIGGVLAILLLGGRQDRPRRPAGARFALIAARARIHFGLLVVDPARRRASASRAPGSGLSLRRFLRV